MISSTSRSHFTPGKDPVPSLTEAGWATGPVWTGGKSAPHRDSTPDRPARSQSLNRLSYRAHCMTITFYNLIPDILIIWMHQATDQKNLESFEMWCLRRMEKISWTDHVRNEEVLLRVNGQRNILHEIIKRKANWIGHMLRRNCLLKKSYEGKIKGQIEVTRRRGRRRKSYWTTLWTGEDTVN